MLSIFGRSISGTITNEQSNLFMLGTGSSGKSLLLKLIEKALECYFQELKGKTFEQANQTVTPVSVRHAEFHLGLVCETFNCLIC